MHNHDVLDARVVLVMRKSKKIVAVIGVTGIAILLCTALFTTVVRELGRDPLDRFQAIRVTSEPGSNRHAVTYRYDHANSSNRIFGIWIVSGSPPAIGSTDPARGTPVAVWTGPIKGLDQRWEKGRLMLFTEDRPQIRADKFNDCYFNYDGPNMLCLDSTTVEFIGSYKQ